MNKLIGILVAVVIGLSMIPIVKTMTEDYDTPQVSENFTAVEVLATPEVVTVSNTPVAVVSVLVDGLELTLTTEYTISGSNITVLANNSDVGDTITVVYTYDLEVSPAMDSLVQLLPILFIIMIVGGLAFALKFK